MSKNRFLHYGTGRSTGVPDSLIELPSVYRGRPPKRLRPANLMSQNGEVKIIKPADPKLVEQYHQSGMSRFGKLRDITYE